MWSVKDAFARMEETSKAERLGWVFVRLVFDTEEEAKRYLLGFATEVRVVDPSSLQQEIRAMAKEVVKMYS